MSSNEGNARLAEREPQLGHDGMTHVITAWLEGEQWRFQVKHVRSGDDRYFARLEDVAALLTERTGVSLLVPGKTRDDGNETGGS